MSEAIEQVVAILGAAGAVTAIVSNRITPLIRPQDLVLPAVTLQEISLTPANTFAGNGNLDDCRVQVNCWAATYTDAKALARAVRAAMDAVPVLMQSKNEGFDLEPVPGLFWITQDYLVWS